MKMKNKKGIKNEYDKNIKNKWIPRKIKLVSKGNPWSVIHWTSMVRNISEYSYTDYVDNFLYTSHFFYVVM